MRTGIARLAGVALTLAVLGGAGTESQAQHSRRTPIVEAVQKTRDAIVTIKVEKRGDYGRKDIVGTGVVVDERGFVVTNRHVVTGADRVAVRLADGSEHTARVHTEDARHDLAVLKVSAGRKLKALPFGPASDLMVGETVIAVGHPFGYTNTVSTGIVSAVGREITMPGGEVLTGLIQTNASINPGNSGGPLLNINGELIGINVALREGAQGIAFALNADAVQRVLSRHLSAGRLAGVAHGIACREQVASEGDARQRVVVDRLADEAQADLRRGDQLTRVGGRAVTNRFDLERALWGCRPGDRVSATVVRGGRESQVELRLGRAEEAAVADAAEAPRPWTEEPTQPVRNRR